MTCFSKLAVICSTTPLANGTDEVPRSCLTSDLGDSILKKIEEVQVIGEECAKDAGVYFEPEIPMNFPMNVNAFQSQACAELVNSFETFKGGAVCTVNYDGNILSLEEFNKIIYSRFRKRWSNWQTVASDVAIDTYADDDDDVNLARDATIEAMLAAESEEYEYTGKTTWFKDSKAQKMEEVQVIAKECAKDAGAHFDFKHPLNFPLNAKACQSQACEKLSNSFDTFEGTLDCQESLQIIFSYVRRRFSNCPSSSAIPSGRMLGSSPASCGPSVESPLGSVPFEGLNALAEGLAKTLGEPSAAKALGDPSAAKALGDPSAAKALGDPSVAAKSKASPASSDASAMLLGVATVALTAVCFLF